MRSTFYLLLGLILVAIPLSAPTLDAVEVDDHPITNDMLAEAYDSTESQDCHTWSERWFVSDSSDQALAMRVVTDHHRLRMVHFEVGNIPDLVIKTIDLYKHRKPMPQNERPGCIQQLLETAQRIPSTHFITKKGLRLGMSSQEAVGRFGDPNKTGTTLEGELYIWDFVGEHALDYRKAEKPDVYAENSWGYHVKILFGKERAIVIILSDDIP